MDFISAEEFLKQPEKVQKVFLNYWEPEELDLVIHSIAIQYNKPSIIVKKKNDYHIEIAGNDGIIITVKNDLIPLFTEGQLRKFIKDKSGKIEFISITENDYVISTFTKYYSVDYAKDLLQAYWQIAIKTAEEETKETE